MKNGYIPSLTGIRAISILMVIFYHLNQRGFIPDNVFLKYCGWFFFNGPLGVNVFFIISGYLITTLLISEKKRTGSISIRQFYIRRIIRIFPAYYTFIIILSVLQFFSYFNYPLVAWFSILTYTKQFFPFYGHEIEHLWSLSVEEFFYLFWPICFLYIGSLQKFALTMIIFFTICRFVFFQYPLGKFNNSIISTGDALFFGCYIGLRIDMFKKAIEKYERNITFVPLGLCGSIILYNYFYHLGIDQNSKFNIVLYMQKLAYALFGSIGLFTNILIGLLIVYCVNSRGTIYRVLNTKLLVFIGTLSYSLYLWQQLFTADRNWLHHLPFFVILIFISIAGILSYYLIEKPFLNLKKRFTINKTEKIL